MENVFSRAETKHFSTVLIFGTIIVIYISAIHCSFRCLLLTVQQEVACHWPTDIPTIGFVHLSAFNRCPSYMMG